MSDDEMTRRFIEAVRIDEEVRRVLGLPSARYDAEKNELISFFRMDELSMYKTHVRDKLEKSRHIMHVKLV